METQVPQVIDFIGCLCLSLECFVGHYEIYLILEDSKALWGTSRLNILCMAPSSSLYVNLLRNLLLSLLLDNIIKFHVSLS